MTRGKYAARAATRRYETDMATTTETYQRQIVKLASERDDLKAKLAQEQRDRAEERKVLKGMVAEGVAPELAARDQLIESLREKLGKQARDLANETEMAERRGEAAVAALCSLGATRLEAIELLLKFLKGDDNWRGVVRFNERSRDPETVEAIQRAKGLRGPAAWRAPGDVLMPHPEPGDFK